jgi:hypothetical protein
MGSGRAIRMELATCLTSQDKCDIPYQRLLTHVYVPTFEARRLCSSEVGWVKAAERVHAGIAYAAICDGREAAVCKTTVGIVTGPWGPMRQDLSPELGSVPH